MRGNQADLGLNHGPGKGSKPRSKYNAHWRQSHDDIRWPGVSGFVRRGAKLVKKYG